MLHSYVFSLFFLSFCLKAKRRAQLCSVTLLGSLVWFQNCFRRVCLLILAKLSENNMLYFILNFIRFDTLQVLFNGWDPSRSIQLIKLYNIARISPSGTFWASISARIWCPGSQMCSKIDPRIVNFGTWVPGRPPGRPPGGPQGGGQGSSEWAIYAF